MKILPTAGRFLLLYLALVAFFVLSLVAVCSLPGDAVRSNIAESLSLLEEEGDHPRVGGGRPHHQLDNYTDSIILNIIYNVDSAKPLDSALRNAYYLEDPTAGSNVPRVPSLIALVENNRAANVPYPRYWHGYMVFIRPLLMLGPYSGVRAFMQIAFFLEFSLIVSLLARRLSLAVALAFAASMALVAFSAIPLSVHFSSVFFVAFAAMIVILLLPDIRLEQAGLFFFAVGAITSFVDFLTAPLVTFGLPAAVLLMLRRQRQPGASLKREALFLAWIGLAWAAGYALLWVSKWLLASLYLQQNVLADGIAQVAGRTGGRIPRGLESGRLLALHAVGRNISTLYSYSVWVSRLLLVAIPVLFLPLLIRWRRRVKDLTLPLVLAAVGLTPYVWFGFASNHTFIHHWVTYRAQAVTIMAALCALYYAVDWEKLAADLRNWRGSVGRPLDGTKD